MTTIMFMLFVAAGALAEPITNWDSLSQLVQGSEIRVTLGNGRVLRGFVQAVTSESLIINATTSQEAIERRDIKRVAQKRSEHRGRNTLLGLGIGAGAGEAQQACPK